MKYEVEFLAGAVLIVAALIWLVGVGALICGALHAAPWALMR